MAVSKYGAPVAYLVTGSHKGFVLILPQMPNKAAFLAELITDVLPELSPHLYESADAATWMYSKPYELERVAALRAEATDVARDAEARIARMNNEIVQTSAREGIFMKS